MPTNANEIQDIHSGNAILTKLMLDADKQNIPKGKMENKNILPEHICTQIRRDETKTANPLDDQLEEQNQQVTEKYKNAELTCGRHIWRDTGTTDGTCTYSGRP